MYSHEAKTADENNTTTREISRCSGGTAVAITAGPNSRKLLLIPFSDPSHWNNNPESGLLFKYNKSNATSAQ